jgi:hypothetical protein
MQNYICVTDPYITNSDPSGATAPGLDHLRVTFNTPMDPTTFTPAQIHSFTDATGQTIQVTGVVPVQGTNNTQFDITFDPQFALGAYTMVIGPDILDPYGNPMDQNRNGIPGEVPDDQYVAQFSIVAPPTPVNITGFHYDPAVTGLNPLETALAPGNVTATSFGKLADTAVDGYVYAQPLYMTNLMIGGTPHNVAFVATEHDSLYAFDVVSDPDTPTGVRLDLLWRRSFINPAAGITTVPYQDVFTTDIVPEIGITGTPVIDPATNVLYVVAKTKEVRGDGTHYVQKLYAVDITSPTGADRTSPYTIGDSHLAGSSADGFNNQATALVVAGSGADNSGGTNPMIRFNAWRANQRAALQLLGGRVYVAWASHADNGPYHGWVVGFNEATLQPEKWFNSTPNARGAGLWQSGGAISTDGAFLYCALGNGVNGPNLAFDPAHGNYSESVLKLDPTTAGTALTVADYFTPYNWQQLDNTDTDVGSSAVVLLPDSVGSPAHPHLMVEAGKNGRLYLIDRNNLGHWHADSDNVVQELVVPPVWSSPAFYQESASSGVIVYHGAGSDTQAFRITGGQIVPGQPGSFITYRSNQTFGFPGAQPIISGNGTNTTTAIDWELQSDNYGAQGSEELHAYVARPSASTGTMTELYNSNQAGQRDRLGGSVKFTSAIVTSGWVLVGQEYNFSVFGLFPSHSAPPPAPANLTGQGVSPTSIQLTWTNADPNSATGIKVFRSTDGANFIQVSTVAASATSYADGGLVSGQTYYYEIAATNQGGDSPFSNVVQVSPLSPAPRPSPHNGGSHNITLGLFRPITDDPYGPFMGDLKDFASSPEGHDPLVPALYFRPTLDVGVTLRSPLPLPSQQVAGVESLDQVFGCPSLAEALRPNDLSTFD